MADVKVTPAVNQDKTTLLAAYNQAIADYELAEANWDSWTTAQRMAAVKKSLTYQKQMLKFLKRILD